ELLMVGAVALSATPVLERFYAEQATSAWILGREAKLRTRFEDVVLCAQPPSLPVLRYYTDRLVEVRVESEADLDAARRQFGSRVALWVCPKNLAAKSLKPFVDWLQSRYEWETVEEGHLIVDLRKPKPRPNG